jgi:hypothetical protein
MLLSPTWKGKNLETEPFSIVYCQQIIFNVTLFFLQERKIPFNKNIFS